MEIIMTLPSTVPATTKEFPARTSPRPEDLLAAFCELARKRGPAFAGVAMFGYLTKHLGAIDDDNRKE
jgi:hypothetical protein